MTATRQDRGAVTIIVAIVVPVIMLVLGGIVVDIGYWYSSRAQTQNGADAGAQAVAISCAKGSCNLSAATTYAPANANSIADVQVNAGFPCGHDSNSSGAHLPSCNSALENGTVCPATHPHDYVNVQTITTTQVGLLGSLSGERTKVAACAQATWGAPSSLSNAVALTMSACEWLKDTNNGTSFASVPAGTPPGSYAGSAPYYTAPPSYLATLTARRGDADYDTTPGDNTTNFYVTNNIRDPHNPVLNAPIAGSETVITTHGFGNTCAAGNPGWAAPGQFGWLSHTTCTADINGNTYTGTTGNTPAPCGPIFLNSLQNKTPIFLPVYTTSTLNGSNTTYTLDGFAAFVVTGWDVSVGGGPNQWNLNGSSVPTRWDSEIEIADASPTSVLSAANKARDAHYCVNAFTGSNADDCIYGYFTQALIPASAVPGGNGGGGNNLGATAPYLTG
jgi:hypothetical protein